MQLSIPKTPDNAGRLHHQRGHLPAAQPVRQRQQLPRPATCSMTCSPVPCRGPGLRPFTRQGEPSPSCGNHRSSPTPGVTCRGRPWPTSSPAAVTPPCLSSEALHDGYPSLPAAHDARRPALPAQLWSLPAAPLPIGLTAPALFAGGEVSRAHSRYVHQAVSPALVALRKHRHLMPDRRRITIRRQSGGGPL